jgi:hypothetical protein
LKNYTKNSSEIQINRRAPLRCERDDIGRKPATCISRLKPNASGVLRAAGAAQLEFAAKHLPGFVSVLQDLLEQLTRQSRAEG